MTTRKNMLKTLKEMERKGWEKAYLPISTISDLIYLLEDRDREKKRAKITALPVQEDKTDGE